MGCEVEGRGGEGAASNGAEEQNTGPKRKKGTEKDTEHGTEKGPKRYRKGTEKGPKRN